MPNFNCCVPGCTNSHRNKPADFKFYCIPKDPKLRQTYIVLLKNETLKVDSPNTRVCADHWEGGEKLSRSHLPSKFPWSTPKVTRRPIKKFDEDTINKCKRRRSTHTISEETFTDTSTDLDVNIQVQDSETQTDLKSEEICQMEKDIQVLKDQIERLKVKNNAIQEQLDEANRETSRLSFQLKNQRFDIDKYRDSNKDIEFYTGFTSYLVLVSCFSMIEKQANSLNYGNMKCNNKENASKVGRPRLLSKFQEFIMVLVRLRLGLFERDLAHRFGVSEASVSVIVRTWITFLSSEFGPLIKLPEKAVIRHYSPESFKTLFPDVVIIVDCTEIEMERPSALDNQSLCYSAYKSRPTMKALLGITPSGVLAFVSELFPGSTSDKEITIKSKFLNILNPNDAVMADKGFNVQDELASVGATLVIPEFLKANNGKKQFSSEQCNRNKMIASLRIHVERLMERIKNWHILDRRIPISMAPYASDIVLVIGALSNFLPPLIS